MKKQSKTTTVYRMDLEKGNYTTIARSILLNTNLTDSAKTLVQLCLNNVEGWKLSLNYFKKQLKWSNDKMAGAVENLITEGYITKDKKPNGKNGFTYIYVISEFGNLNPNKEQPNVEQIAYSIELDEASEIILQEEPIQQEIEQQEAVNIDVVAEATAETTIQITQQELDAFNLRLQSIMIEIDTDYRISDDFISKVINFYVAELDKDNLNLNKFTNELIKKQITNSIQKNEATAMKQINEWIEFHNKRGTAVQREDIKNKTIKYFQERWGHPLEEVQEKDVTHRLLLYRTEILSANRVHDSRFQD